MKKLFGEFLVEKGIVSEVDLLDALMKQMSGLPTVVELVYQNKLIPNSDILKVLAHQSKQNVEFKKACEDLSLWSQETEERIAHEINKIKIPVGQLLVAGGKITFQKITMALDEYLAEIDDKASEPPTVTVPVIAKPVASLVAEDTVTESAPPPTHSAAIESYSEFLNETRKTALMALLSNITQEGADPLESVQLFHQGIHELKGMARFIRAAHSEVLLDEVETLITVIQLQGGANKDQLIQFSEKCTKAIELLWEVKNGICANGSEESFWVSVQENFDKLVQDLKNVATYILTGSQEETKEAA